MNIRTRVITITVDEDWYIGCYPEIRKAVQDGRYATGIDHFIKLGLKQGLLPMEPIVDEAHYLRAYPDVGKAIRRGEFKNAFDHYVHYGYREDRQPVMSGPIWKPEKVARTGHDV